MKTPNWLPRAATLSTTVFGTTAIGVAAFIVLAAVVFAAVTWQANRFFVSDVLETLSAELKTLVAASEASTEAELVSIVTKLSNAQSKRLYVLVAKDGRSLAGQLKAVPDELRNSPEGGLFEYQPPNATSSEKRTAAGLPVTLSSGARLVVARDIEDQRALIRWFQLLALVAFVTIVVGGLALGVIASRTVLARVDEMSDATRAIMAGDFTGRLPVEGNGDELDRLSQRVNEMLGRIELLMHGLKEVSDNIAHDLKTPLNRLRNRAETALRSARTQDELAAGLGETIEAADEIIKTFNALLLIARLEAGAIEETKAPVDLPALLSDAAELYEPVAEEAGLTLIQDEFANATISANRHLIGQAVINLIDNAIKYSRKTAPTNGTSTVAGLINVSLNITPSGLAEITIADNGPGISSQDRARATERFVRLDKSRTSPGTGLGLSLVAAVARMHDGELRLEDNGPGLKAILALPLV
ncbi:MAG: HAMP domain-containing sensor histidine kinase [Filomicrobium sp.]